MATRRGVDLIRSAALVVNRPVAERRLRRDLPAVERPFPLEIGGKRPRPGWVVTDAAARSRHFLDATGTWPIEDDALTFVYADNVVEHLGLDGFRAMAAEAHRCLRPGGAMRLVVPDIRRHVELYLRGADALTDEVAERYRSFGLVVEHPVDLVRIPIGEFGHHEGYSYDFDVFESELARAGFREVSRPDVGASVHPELRGLEERTDPGQAQLVVEAVR